MFITSPVTKLLTNEAFMPSPTDTMSKKQYQNRRITIRIVMLTLVLILLMFFVSTMQQTTAAVGIEAIGFPTIRIPSSNSAKATPTMLRTSKQDEQRQPRQRRQQQRHLHDHGTDIQSFKSILIHQQQEEEQTQDHWQISPQRLSRLPHKSKIRIVNGQDANPIDRYPYFVSLVDRTYTHRCGGTLIAPDVVLTAAHCKA